MSDQPTVTLPQPGPTRTTIERWAGRLALTDRRPELIGAFVADQRAAGTVSAEPDEFSARYVDFCNRPA